jgi:ferredoxin
MIGSSHGVADAVTCSACNTNVSVCPECAAAYRRGVAMENDKCPNCGVILI